MKRNAHCLLLFMVPLLWTALCAPASSVVAFQIDMSVAAGNAAFDPGTQTVAARGSFDAWKAFNLTNNPSGANPLVYSGTTNIPTNGIVITYKYTIEPGSRYETTAIADRLLDLPATNGGSVTAPLVYYSDNPPGGTPPTTVTFRADMAQQINIRTFNPSTSTVYVRGTFNSWSASTAMTSDPSILTTNQFGLVSSNVYVASYDVAGSPGETLDFKFYIDTGANWESLSRGPGKDPTDNNNNRYFNVAASSPQKLPILYFNDAPYSPIATNEVTFQVDMTAQVLNGNFDPSTGTVEVRGNFNGWGTTQTLCTNDIASANTNLYTAAVRIVDGIGATEQYKFWASVAVNSGWETMQLNRTLSVIKGPAQILPRVYFSDVAPGDLLPADTLVTFSVDMTNAVGTDAHAFDPSTDQVYINGVFGFVGWDAASLAAFQLTNNPMGSEIYSLQVLMPRGSPVEVTYKYSINGPDNEAASGQNHVRFVRQAGSYVMPQDTFGNELVEVSFGNLQASTSTPGHVLISWLGRPGVHLQSSGGVSAGSWQDYPETDGAGSTNWPTAGAGRFFRLIRPF